MRHRYREQKKNNVLISRRLFALILFFCAACASQAVKPNAHVLLINSYHHGLSWTDNITDAVQETLASHAALHIEYLDTKRQPLDQIDRAYAELLKNRHKMRHFSAVIVSDNDALAFKKRNVSKL